MSEVRKVVLVARFSAFTGADTWRSAPIDVREFSRAVLTGWRCAFGSSMVLQLLLEESVDLVAWTTVANSLLIPSANAESTTECEFEKPWVRAVVDLQGTEPAVTCWLVASMVARDR